MTDETHKKLTEAVAYLLLQLTSPPSRTPELSADYMKAARADVYTLLARARHERDYPEDRG